MVQDTQEMWKRWVAMKRACWAIWGTRQPFAQLHPPVSTKSTLLATMVKLASSLAMESIQESSTETPALSMRWIKIARPVQVSLNQVLTLRKELQVLLSQSNQRVSSQMWVKGSDAWTMTLHSLCSLRASRVQPSSNPNLLIWIRSQQLECWFAVHLQ